MAPLHVTREELELLRNALHRDMDAAADILRAGDVHGRDQVRLNRELELGRVLLGKFAVVLGEKHA